MTVLVINLPFLRIFKYLVCLGSLLEFFLGFVVAGIAVVVTTVGGVVTVVARVVATVVTVAGTVVAAVAAVVRVFSVISGFCSW